MHLCMWPHLVQQLSVIEGQLQRTNKLCSGWFCPSNCVDSWSGWGKEEAWESVDWVRRNWWEDGAGGTSQWVWSTSSRGWMCCARNMRSMTSISSGPLTLCRGMTNFWSFTRSSRLTSRPLFRYLCMYVWCHHLFDHSAPYWTQGIAIRYFSMLGREWSWNGCISIMYHGRESNWLAIQRYMQMLCFYCVVWKGEQLTRNLMWYGNAVFLWRGMEGRVVDIKSNVDPDSS